MRRCQEIGEVRAHCDLADAKMHYKKNTHRITGCARRSLTTTPFSLAEEGGDFEDKKREIIGGTKAIADLKWV